MIKVYPDRRWPAFLRVLADTVTTSWSIVWAYLGFLIYQTVMGLEVIADGITSTGTTFNSWIASFRHAVPGGIPFLTQFLLDTADALKKYSGIRWCRPVTRFTTRSCRPRSCSRCWWRCRRSYW